MVPIRTLRHLLPLAAIPLALAACAPDDDGAASAEAPVDTATPVAEVVATVDVNAGDTALGEILVGPNGLSLYGFTNDINAISACYGSCADAWPPVIVDVDWTAGPGLDFGIFATTVREDGRLQLVAGQWPLYYFAGDSAPGDLKGQGSGDVWFVVDLDGRLITAAAPAPTALPGTDAPEGGDEPGGDSADAAPSAPETGTTLVADGDSDLGTVLTDGGGLTLYGFLNDTDGVPSCDGACADAWPPLLVAGPELPAGLDPQVHSVAQRADGTFQLVAGNWPLYRFAGDGAPGDINGQGSGDVWFAVAPDGSLIRGGDAEGATSVEVQPGGGVEIDAGTGSTDGSPVGY